MNVIVVDTSSWISYFAGDDQPELDDALEEGRVYLPPIVAAELLSGRLTRRRREQLVDFLDELPLCDGSLAHWFRVGALRAHLASKGLNVSTPDAHVAQCGLDLNGYVMTQDRVFRQIAEVQPLRVIA